MISGAKSENNINVLKNSSNNAIDQESILLQKDIITPQDVITLRRPTNKYLCPLEANIYGIDFVRFQIRELPSNKIIFQVNRDDQNAISAGEAIALSEYQPEPRYIRYRFDEKFLKLRTVGTTVEFTVGDEQINDFRMIEHHYFKDRLLKTFDFDFGFCIPHTSNTCEHIYELPSLTNQQIRDMIKSPYQTKSDSFYFIDNKLFMHNKAEYAFNSNDSSTIE